jgi:hypothetical protein
MTHSNRWKVLVASSAALAAAGTACGGTAPVTSRPPGLTASGGDASVDQASPPDAAGGVAPAMGALADAAADTGADGADVADAAPGALVRFANWAPDAPAAGFDVCLAPRGTQAWTGPVLGAGVAFPQVSEYVSVPPGGYDLSVVAPGSGCMPAVVSSVGLPDLAANARTTFALLGDIRPVNRDPRAKLAAFLDDLAAGPQAALRFINATPAASAVDFGTGSLGAGDFSPLALDVEYGLPSSALPEGGAADFNGYLPAAASAGVTLSAHAVAAGTDLATGLNATWGAGGLTTVALVNGANGGPAPQLVLCHDDAPPAGGLTSCATLAP